MSLKGSGMNTQGKGKRTIKRRATRTTPLFGDQFHTKVPNVVYLHMPQFEEVCCDIERAKKIISKRRGR